MRRQLVVNAIIFSLGILTAAKINIQSPLLYAFLIIFLILSLVSFRKQGLFAVFVSCLIFAIGIASLKNAQSLPKYHISNFIYYKNKEPYIVKGFINSQPVFKNRRAYFIFKTQAIQLGNVSYACSGNILVYLKGKENLRYGDALILRGALKPSYRDYLYNQDIRFILYVKNKIDTLKLNKNNGFFLKRFALWLNQKTQCIIFKYVSSLPASILDAMILGERRNIPAFINNSMIKSGTVHILPCQYTKMPSIAL